MRQLIIRFSGRVVLLLGSGFLVTLIGCYNPPPERGADRPAGSQVVEQDDYVYYPGYEVYYNNTRHQYVYREDNAWVNRPQPPRAWAQTLPGSPSVHVDFHDAPERHHAEIVREYPKNWQPSRPVDAPRDDHPADKPRGN